MSSVLRNVVIHPPIPPRPTESMFRTISRTDGKTSNPQPPAPARPVISEPQKCPLCGSRANQHPNLFTFHNGLYKCNVCNTQIDRRGEIVVNGVF